MAKYNLVFVLALFAFSMQVTTGASFHNPNNNILRETLSGQEMQHVIDEVDKVIIDVSSTLSNLLHDLSTKFNSAQTEANFPAIITQLKQNINTLSADKEVSEICSSATLYEVRLLEEFIEESSTSCRFTLDEEVKPLQKNLEKLVGELQGFLQQINKAVFKCFMEIGDEGRVDKFGRCMEGTVNMVKEGLEKVKEATVEALNSLEELYPVFEVKVVKCVKEMKKKVEEKAQVVVDDLKKCAQIQSPLTKRMLCWPNVHIPICDDYDYEQW